MVIGDGIWRLRKLEKSSTLELFKLEESGHGSILSENFLQWRRIGMRAGASQTTENTALELKKGALDSELPSVTT